LETPAERMLDNMTTAIAVFDDRLRLRYLNPAGEALFSRSLRHARNKTIEELIGNADTVTEQLTAAMQSGNAVTRRGCRLALPDAGIVRVNCTATPLINSDGSGGAMMELRQVDHHFRIEQEEHLINQQEAARALVRGLAHEIKNPLGGLRGAAQLLEREVEAESLKEYTRVIIGEADRLQNLMDRMLGPNNVPNMVATNIHKVLGRVLDLVQAEAGPGLVISKDYDPSLPDLQADPELLVQALLNIVRNAAQALEGQGEITLQTRAQRQMNIGSRKYRLVARVDIIDNGPGVDEQIREQIFYPMITTRSKGTGLGLSIAQSLINRHKGLVECSSRPGKTVFTVLLPLDERP